VIPFIKMHGAGNDFVCLDLISRAIHEDWGDLARAMCDRKFGVGADGVLLIERGDRAPFRMRMFNPDGSEAEMCGNGTRCVGRFLVDNNHSTAGEIDLEVFGRVVHLSVGPKLVSVDMGPVTVEGPVTVTVPIPRQEPITLEGTRVDVGNPHVVIVVDNLEDVTLKKWGSAIEHDPQFPNGTNVHFVQILNPDEVRVLHWERGAGATLACGSGTCAVAGVLLPGAGTMTVHVPGGTVSVEIDGRGHAIKTGPAVPVFTGTWG